MGMQWGKARALSGNTFLTSGGCRFVEEGVGGNTQKEHPHNRGRHPASKVIGGRQGGAQKKGIVIPAYRGGRGGGGKSKTG